MHILSLILGYLLRMALPALAGGLLCLCLTPLRRRRLVGNGLYEAGVRALWLALFAAYLAGLFRLIVLPSALPDGTLHYNLIPFRIFSDVTAELQEGNAVGFVISFLGNIIMFLPVGFFPALLWRDFTWRRAVAVGFFWSLTIELCQLPLGRSADVDDLWMNTVSAGLGYGFYHWLDVRKPSRTNCCKVQFKTEEEGSSWM